MLKRTLMIFATLALICAPLMGEEPMQGEGGMQMPEMGPPKQLAEMGHLPGTWTGDFMMRMDPSADFVGSPATYVFSTFMDGCGYQGDFSTNVMGMPFKGQVRITYNRETSKWQATWVDNMGANTTYMDGTKTGNVINLTGTYTQAGQGVMMRETTTIVSDTEFTWSMEESHDGGKTWFEGMKATYKKQK